MGRLEAWMVQGPTRAHKRESQYDDARHGVSSVEHRLNIQMMLSQIDAALAESSDTERACFVLYYGLAPEHGRWTKTRIALWYDISREDVAAYVTAAEDKMPSLDHLSFARTFFREQ